MTIILLLAGFVLLMKGADAFVQGSSSVAKILRIPAVIIGLTIVAMGTSLPEASVSITASMEGMNEISVSNVVGSNIFNLMAIVGICAMIKRLPVEPAIGKRDMFVSIGTTALLLVFMLDGMISRLEGLGFILGTIGYMVVLIRSGKKEALQEEDTTAPLSLGKSLIFIVLGLAAIIVGGNLVVDQACIIAEAMGMSQNFIGLTIVAIGTSLPELVTSLVAATKGESALALGNVVGSNILNILVILGASSVISPLAIQRESIIDVVLLLMMTLMMLVFVKTEKEINRREGAASILIYVAYSIYIALR